MINIDRWFLDFSRNSVNIDNIDGLNRFMKFLEEHQYQVGEKTSFYEFSEEPQSKEFRANLYFGRIGLLKIIIHIDTSDVKKSYIVIQKIKKVETDCIKIQSISKQLENEWIQVFSNRKYQFNKNEFSKLIDGIISLTQKVKEYIDNPFIIPKTLDFATFLEEMVQQNKVYATKFVADDYKLDPLKVDNIIRLMKENYVLRLESNMWYLTVKGDYFNGYAPKPFEYGNIYSDSNYSSFIFINQDKFINPFFSSSITYNPSKLDVTAINDRKDFRLICFEIFNGYLKNIKFELGADKQPKEDEPFVTILIGSNGTGKTRALSIIESIFQDLNTLKTKKKRLGKLEYNVKYKIGDLLHDITIKEDKMVFLINENKVSIKEVLLPNKLLACSFNVDDKFTFKSYSELDDDNNEFYEYLGIKSASNAVHVGAASKKLALNIIKYKDDIMFLDKLHKILYFLGLSPIFKLKFRINNDMCNANGINWGEINKSIEKKNKNKNEADRLIQDEDKNVYYDYLKKKEREYIAERNSPNSSLIEINYEINSEEPLIDTLKEELEIVYILIKLKVLVAQGIEFKKKEFFRVELASSGENHMLFEMINILSYVKENSLILIDEPEISLHPNWQYKYVELLNDIFNNSSCHFIIATHSHFIISDLKPDSSSILSLTYNDQGSVQTELHDEKTYGWSAEDVLYNIFRMKTVRNHFIEQDLRKVLGLISAKSKQFSEIKRILVKLEKLSIKSEDPLNLIINEIKEYLGEND